MIAKIRGTLESLGAGSALLGGDGGLTYEVLLPGYVVARLGGSIGQTVDLHTLHYVESQNQGATLVPRLVGFLTTQEKSFYELFITCKGIGHRKALRAMALDIGTIAAAIADRDVSLLQTLPEIGRRTAETIIATLHGKVDRFVDAAAGEGARPAGTRAAGTAGAAGGLGRDALDVLVQLGESRAQAAQWVDEALRSGEKFADVQELVLRAYQVKRG